MSCTTGPRPIDLRYVDGDPMSRKGTPSEGQRVWLRADGTLPDDRSSTPASSRTPAT